MSTLYLDLEIFSPVNLKTAGVYRYAEQAEILLFAYALDNGPVEVWDCTAQKEMPDSLKQAIKKADYVCAHNSGFDRVILEHCLPGVFNAVA